MRAAYIEDILDGVALLECYSCLYEYAGCENGRYLFRCVGDDSVIRVSYDELRQNSEYDIQY